MVTPNIKLWAKKALEEEKALRPVEARNTVAVLYFENKTGNPDLDPLQKGLALMLITDLSTLKGLQVVERIKLQALVEEMGFGTAGLVQPGTAPRVGRLLGARWIIGGEIVKGSIHLKSTLLDVGEQRIVGQPLVTGELADLFRLEKELLFKLIEFLKIEVSPQEREELRKYISTNLRALTLLFKGIEASDRGQYEKAGQFYESALKEDPKIFVARSALQELIQLKLIKPQKRTRELLNSLRDRSSLTDQLTPEDATRRGRGPSEITPSKGERPYNPD
ncbi:MAG: CsgG/HfaB family protein [Desulfobacterota bacterium]|nr:CsgG/HfaB family protein [Thermodesulfobacteriota bacterium]